VVTPSNTGPALEMVFRWLRTGQVPSREVLLPPRSHPPEGAVRARGAADGQEARLGASG